MKFKGNKILMTLKILTCEKTITSNCDEKKKKSNCDETQKLKL